MKFLPSLATAIAALLFAAGTTSAQSAVIGYPLAGGTTSVIAGGQFTFDLDRQIDRDFAGPTTEAGITVDLHTCATNCAYQLDKHPGKPVYTGPYHPVVHETWRLPYQKFTVTIPLDTRKGPALLGVRRTASYYAPGRIKKPLVENFDIYLTIV